MNAFLISMNQSKYTVTSLDKKKKNRDLASTRFRIHTYSKISALDSGFKKLRIRMLDSLDTYGRKPNP